MSTASPEEYSINNPQEIQQEEPQSIMSNEDYFRPGPSNSSTENSLESTIKQEEYDDDFLEIEENLEIIQMEINDEKDIEAFIARLQGVPPSESEESRTNLDQSITMTSGTNPDQLNFQPRAQLNHKILWMPVIPPNPNEPSPSSSEQPTKKRQYQTGLTPEQRKELERLRRQTPEFRAKETARKAAYRAKKYQEDPQYRAKESQQTMKYIRKRLQEDPEYRAILSARKAEYRRKRRQLDPEFKAKAAAYRRMRRRTDPEYRAKENAQRAEYQRKRRQLDPEARAKENAQRAEYQRKRRQLDPEARAKATAQKAEYRRRKAQKNTESKPEREQQQTNSQSEVAES